MRVLYLKTLAEVLATNYLGYQILNMWKPAAYFLRLIHQVLDCNKE